MQDPIARQMSRELREGLEQVAAAVAARPATSSAESVVAGELAAVRGELTRVDAKCATLVGLAAAGMAFTLTSASSRAPVVERVLLVVAAGALASSALVLLLQALRPRLGGSGFCRWSAQTPVQVVEDLADVDPARHHAGELAVLSQIAVKKFRAVRRSVDLLAAGMVLLAAAIVAGVIA